MNEPFKTPSEDEIDEIVATEDDDESAWEKPIRVRPPKTEQIASLSVTSDPEVLSGATVFSGTRVPVAALLDNIEAGLTLDEFLDNFPTVTREQAIQVLNIYSKE